MLSDSTKKELLTYKPPKEESVGRMIYFLYRYLTVWGENHWPTVEGMQLGPSHIHLLAVIGLDGLSNSEMAKRAKVSKQAMSKLVKEMLKHELIVIEPNEQDCRCNVISLTEKGASILRQIWETNKVLNSQFEKALGKARSKNMMVLMSELVDMLKSNEQQAH